MEERKEVCSNFRSAIQLHAFCYKKLNYKKLRAIIIKTLGLGLPSVTQETF